MGEALAARVALYLATGDGREGFASVSVGTSLPGIMSSHTVMNELINSEAISVEIGRRTEELASLGIISSFVTLIKHPSRVLLTSRRQSFRQMPAFTADLFCWSRGGCCRRLAVFGGDVCHDAYEDVEAMSLDA